MHRPIAILLAALLQGATACFPTAQRAYSYGAPTQTGYAQPIPPPAYSQGGYPPQGASAPVFAVPRVAAAGHGPTQPLPTKALEAFFGPQVSLTEFTADGYNAEGGGPVQSGASLTCNFDGRPCCWANVVPGEDQLDWQFATGTPEHPAFKGSFAAGNSYLVAYAKAAAPSDEAQFASCSIGCASSDIRVRVKHWQSDNVLLQVCLRESFPANANNNPLLNCQELKATETLAEKEIVLPKTSLVDIVFVASSFVGEHGDMALIDDIEVSYDRNGEECEATLQAIEQQKGQQEGAAHRQTIETKNNQKTAVFEKKSAGGAKNGDRFETFEGGKARPAAEKFGEKGFQGGHSFGNQGGEEGEIVGEEEEEAVIESIKTNARGSSKEAVVKGVKTELFSEQICQSLKCDFEAGNTCNYRDAHQTQSIRGLTTKFQVVKGHFMNRVTGVEESIEGNYYAATFLFPREMAGLEVDTKPFTEESRIRFHYYEGTHGVQLKGCCGDIESCPFSSDKFVSVSDRVWKTTSFKCPVGTDKVVFLCENTRTNQGACAVDDIGLIETNGSLKTVKPLC